MCISQLAGSSNGRTADFGSAYHGSNPCPAAIKKDPILGPFLW